MGSGESHTTRRRRGDGEQKKATHAEGSPLSESLCDVRPHLATLWILALFYREIAIALESGRRLPVVA